MEWIRRRTGSRVLFLFLFTVWGFIFPKLLCLHGYCYQELEATSWVRSHGILFAVFLVVARLGMIASLPFFVANLWGYLR